MLKKKKNNSDPYVNLTLYSKQSPKRTSVFVKKDKNRLYKMYNL